jgi:hypothetical protein
MPDTGERTNHAVSRPQISAWRSVIGHKERATPHKFQGHCRSLDEEQSRNLSCLLLVIAFC